ncbi:hypothetical protein F511_28793 [Dorcoceras hygrometricum]|uniref:Uncharacterized protein n=1 Tax=Dorcoceras hygrometricum TaxID=472368 RepID=A0A2Z7DKX4_9LAMI|nr:hypothetical protein F511_28793 [Dorcoceras hygrometricum]
MQMLCMRPGITVEGYNQGREPKNSMHSSTESATDMCDHANNSLRERYRMEELDERNPALPQTYQTVTGNDGNCRRNATVNTVLGFEATNNHRENIANTCVTLNGSGIQLAVGPQPLWLRNHNFVLAQRIMVKRLATSLHDPLGITDSACKNQLVVVSVQYGPFNTYIPIRSTTIGKSRVARDPIAMHTSWRSNRDIASVTSIGYPRMKASGESSTTKPRLLHASGPHPIPPPNDPKRVGKRVKVRRLSCRVSMTFRVVRTNQYNQDLELIHSTNGNHLESPNEGSSIDHQVTIHYQNIALGSLELSADLTTKMPAADRLHQILIRWRIDLLQQLIPAFTTKSRFLPQHQNYGNFPELL